ncbi:MAG: alpha/beta fold hydrolase [Arenimonas sp.]
MASFPDYPFTPKRFDRGNGIGLSYLDEGPAEADPVVMLHGNPSWSYYWRHLVTGLRDGYRCIVPDHVGMGLSDKPDDGDYRYTLQSRVDDLDRLVTSLGLSRKITLAVHDWGGMVGFAWAMKHPERIARLVILNTASFPLPKTKKLPWQIALGRIPLLGAVLIRGFNFFARGAADLGVLRPIPPVSRKALLAPYDSWAHRRAVHRFVQDIPLKPDDAAWPLVQQAEVQLPHYRDRPAFIGWGLQDFVFDQDFLAHFVKDLPAATQKIYGDAGHYVLEDKHEDLVPAIRQFLDRHPIG